jgi:ATP-dependent Clp protease, protease subunit
MTKKFQMSAPATLMAKWDTSIKAEKQNNTIEIFDIIDERGGVGVGDIRERLKEIGNKRATVLINSPGGDVPVGVSIYNELKTHEAGVDIKVMGIAASAASVIAMAGETIEMMQGSMMMVHNAWTVAFGNRHDMNYISGVLSKVDASMREIYAKKTGIDDAKLTELLDNETYLSGKEAVELGFATHVSDDEPDRDKTNASLSALRTIEAALQAQGLSRSERRDILKTLKTEGKQNATDEDDKLSAVDLSETVAEAAKLKAILKGD